MTPEQRMGTDPHIQAALAELEALIRGQYPSATFEVFHGEDPEGIYLRTTVDVADTDEVVDVFIDRLVDLQVDDGLPVYIIPVRPLARTTEELKARSTRLHGIMAMPPLT